MILGRRDLRAKASMQCLFGLVNEPYFILFSRISFNLKVLILGRPGLASHLEVTLALTTPAGDKQINDFVFDYPLQFVRTQS